MGVATLTDLCIVPYVPVGEHKVCGWDALDVVNW